jgi:hypothetical protein
MSYDDFIIEPMTRLEFNNLILQNPSLIAISYDEYIPIISNTSIMNCNNSTIIINNTIPNYNQENQNINYINDTSNNLNPWIISLTIILSTSIILVFVYILLSYYKQILSEKYTKCPYCIKTFQFVELKEHLIKCKEHLELFELIEKVKIVEKEINHENIYVNERIEKNNIEKILIFSKRKNELVNPRNLEHDNNLSLKNSETIGLVEDNS